MRPIRTIVAAVDFSPHSAPVVDAADRDSELLAPLFDERDPGVLRLIEMVLERTHRAGRRVGICGQAPSDHPELAGFLAKIGIDSISLVPDALSRVARHLAAV